MSKEEIEESSVTEGLLRRNGSSGGSTGSLRWVDGNELVDQDVVVDNNEEIRESNYGSVRRRLKKPKRVDSLDVESMQIKGAHGSHHKQVILEDLTYMYGQCKEFYRIIDVYSIITG